MEICYLREFTYRRGKPIIKLKFNYPTTQKGRYLELLLDSGADYTMLSPADASSLGISYEDLGGNEREVEAANLGVIKTKETHLIIEIDSLILPIPVLISDQYTESPLGRKGLFDAFDICFKQSQNKIVFTKAS